MSGFQESIKTWGSPHVWVFFYDGCRNYFYQHFIIFRRRFSNLFELKNLGWAELCVHNRFHFILQDYFSKLERLTLNLPNTLACC